MTDEASTRKLIVPFMAPIYDGLADYAYPILRVAAGLIYVRHGYDKLFGGAFNGTVGFFTKLGLEPAAALVTYVGIIEFFGGILIALGLLTRPFAACAAINLFAAAFYVHWSNGYAWNKGGYEYALLWGLVMVVIFIRGGHHHSVDKAIGREF